MGVSPGSGAESALTTPYLHSSQWTVGSFPRNKIMTATIGGVELPHHQR